MASRQMIAFASLDALGLSGAVSPHFGRCPFYTLIEVDDGATGAERVVTNPGFREHRPGAVPAFVRGLGADVVVAGGMGPRAIALFGQHGVEVVTGAEGTVGDALRAYLDGRLRGAGPCAHDHPEGHGGCGGHDGHAGGCTS